MFRVPFATITSCFTRMLIKYNNFPDCIIKTTCCYSEYLKRRCGHNMSIVLLHIHKIYVLVKNKYNCVCMLFVCLFVCCICLIYTLLDGKDMCHRGHGLKLVCCNSVNIP